MGLFSRKSNPLLEEVQRLQEQNAANAQHFQESITELELAIEDEGWQQLVFGSALEFSRPGLDKLVRLARLTAIKNPLVRRACRVEALYVFGQGVEVDARDEEINDVVQRFMTDRGNRKVLFGHKARKDRLRTMKTDGNLFLGLFPNRVTGHVQVRRIPFQQVVDIICDPDDTETVWFYRRQWSSGGQTNARLYPDWCYSPARIGRPSSWRGTPIDWDMPVYHLSSEGLDDMRFGIPEIYSSLDWARAYKGYLENFLSVAASLQQFAWMITGSKPARRSAMTRLSTKLGGEPETNPAATAGSAAGLPQGAGMTPVPKSGMNVDADGARQVRLMVASATDLPDTILAGDPNQGNLATATTLDRPTELLFRDQQLMVSGFWGDLIEFAVLADVRATGGLIHGGRVVRDPVTLAETVEYSDSERDTAVAVSFPPILERDLDKLVASVAAGVAAGLIPVDEGARRVLLALGVEDVDELVEELRDARELGAERAAVEAVEVVEEALRVLQEAIAA